MKRQKDEMSTGSKPTDCARLAKISVTEDLTTESERGAGRKGKGEGGSGTSGGKEKKHRLDRSFRYRSNTRR